MNVAPSVGILSAFCRNHVRTNFCIFQLLLIIVSAVVVARCQWLTEVSYMLPRRALRHIYVVCCIILNCRQIFHHKMERNPEHKARINWKLLLITDLNVRRITRNWHNRHFYSAQVFIIDLNIVKFEIFNKWNFYKFDGMKIGTVF